MGVAILAVIVLGAGGAVLTALYARAYGRAGFDDWGNYLTLLPMFSLLFGFLPLIWAPLVMVLPVLFGVALFGTPVLILVRKRCPLLNGGLTW